MNLPRLSKPVESARAGQAYASTDTTAGVLAGGQAARLRRLDAPDMVGTQVAAQLAGATPATIAAWIGNGRCIGLVRLTRGYRLPAWQFEPRVFDAIKPIAKAMDTTDGWALLSFMETPHGGLDGLTPRQALEQGQRDRVVALASAF